MNPGTEQYISPLYSVDVKLHGPRFLTKSLLFSRSKIFHKGPLFLMYASMLERRKYTDI